MTAYHVDFPWILFEHVDSSSGGGGKGILSFAVRNLSSERDLEDSFGKILNFSFQ